MPGPDWIPLTSQTKSALQLATLDLKGAWRTQENFWNECPGFSQVTSLAKLAFGNTKGAVDTQIRCLKTINGILNGIPVFGHFKALVHHMEGDHEGGNQALYAATRPVVIMGGATVGALATGGFGAIPAGIAAGMNYDAVVTILTGKRHGCCEAIDNFIENPADAGAFFDAIFIPYSDSKTATKGYKSATRAHERPWTAPRAHERSWTPSRSHGRSRTARRSHGHHRTARRSHGHHSSYDEYY